MARVDEPLAFKATGLYTLVMAEHPSRGSRADYDVYLSRMDASMRQKVALTAAYLLCEGQIADMGMGSGAGSHALASLYPQMQVIGVDLDPKMVELAMGRYQLDNLDFRVGDIAERVFEAGELEGIFNSSVLHHVTTFSGYDHDAARRALAVQSEQLSEGGVLIVRDFIAPEDIEVILDLPADDGDESTVPTSCSTAHLFERFTGEFRSLHPTPGFRASAGKGEGEPPLREGWRRYRMSSKHAAEFILRKDYRDSWSAEVKEEYTYFNQAQFEEAFHSLGLRILASVPIWNPWIVANRFEGKFMLWNGDWTPAPLPATNYIVAGQRVGPSEGVRFEEEPATSSTGYLRFHHYWDVNAERGRDLVSRPNPVLEVIPTFEEGGAVYVLARMSYPRPILGAGPEPTVDGVRAACYVTEPLNVPFTSADIEPLVQSYLPRALGEPGLEIHSITPGSVYYPSPGGIQEEVVSCFADISPLYVREPVDVDTGFSGAGIVRAMEARQLLRAAQVGGIADARLEVNVYDLLLTRGRPVGPWIGAEMVPHQGQVLSGTTGVDQLLAERGGNPFREREASSEGEFLRLCTGEFQELTARGEACGQRALDYVVPKGRSDATVSAVLVAHHRGSWHLGLEGDDLPAAQVLGGESRIPLLPAWRLPAGLDEWSPMIDWIRERIRSEHGVETGRQWRLGGRYHPSPGLTPEYVVPLVFEVLSVTQRVAPLRWVPLRELVDARDQIRDGHLKISLLRAAHALDLL